jgi:hypothetical protein
MISHKDTLVVLGDELTRLEVAISRLRVTRERTTYRLEQAVRERDRVARHLTTLAKEEGAALTSNNTLQPCLRFSRTFPSRPVLSVREVA